MDTFTCDKVARSVMSVSYHCPCVSIEMDG